MAKLRRRRGDFPFPSAPPLTAQPASPTEGVSVRISEPAWTRCLHLESTVHTRVPLAVVRSVGLRTCTVTSGDYHSIMQSSLPALNVHVPPMHPSPWPQATSDPLTVPTVLSFPECHGVGIT